MLLGGAKTNKTPKGNVVGSTPTRDTKISCRYNNLQRTEI